MSAAARREPRAGVQGTRLAWFAAFLLTLGATFLDVATFATNDTTRILYLAIACAGAAILLLVACFGGMSFVGRASAALLVLADLLVLLDAGGRRLLHWWPS